jgi:tetratricopeptide (TPR) repeat protein
MLPYTTLDYNSKAIQLRPDFAEVYGNRGNALRDLGDLEKAVESYDKANRLKPDYAEAYSNRCNALRDLGPLEKAVGSFEKAIQLKPDYAKAHHNLSALKEYKPNDAQIALMENLFTEPKLSELDRIHLCFSQVL